MTRSEPRAAKPRQQSAFLIPSLDGIRALAFLLVFLGHVGMPGIPGGFGVTVFFFLSGYLITTLLRLEVERTGHISFKAFYLRRALRILPPFYLVLLVAALLTGYGLVPGTLSAGGVRAEALHYFNYWVVYRGFEGIPNGTGVYWSLAIEEHFYAVFPALYALLIRAKLPAARQRIVFFLICAGVLLWRCVLVYYFHSPSNRTYLATDTRCDSLLLGCALAVAGNPMLDGGPIAERPSHALRASLLISAVMLLSSFVVRDAQFRETFRYTIQICGLYAFFYAAIRYPKWGAFRVFNLRPMRFLGKLSYSLYLVHQVVVALAWQWLPFAGVPRAVVVFAGALGLAWSMWLLVEKPCADLRKRLEVYQAAAPRAERLPMGE
jgi:peptidoglycan/LPS O-acetylase OafA/YrhL